MSWSNNLCVRVYVPSSCNLAAVECHLPALGGFTRYDGATGVWCAPELMAEPVTEAVVVFEAYTDVIPLQYMEQLITHMGQQFMQDNPNEQCFMSTLVGYPNVHRTFLLNRKDIK